MKKALLTLAALLLPTAQAAQLVTVTVNLSPKNVRASMFLINQDKNAPKAASCFKDATDKLSCKVPIGNYQISAYSPNDGSIEFKKLEKNVKITKSITLNYTVNAVFKKPKEPSLSGSEAFNSLAISINAVVDDCNRYVLARLCGVSPLDVQMVRSMIGLSAELKQKTAWSNASGLVLGDFVTASGDPVQIILSSTSSNGTLIQFIAP